MTKKLLFLGVFVVIIITAVIILIMPGEQQNISQPVTNTSLTPLPTPLSSPVAQPLEVTILSTPQTATIVVDGLNIGQTPLQYTFNQNQNYQLKALKEGYIPLIITYTPNESTLRLQLQSINTPSTAPDMVISNTTAPVLATPQTTSKPQATLSPLPFPSAPDLRVVTRTNNTFTYTPAASTPTTTSTPVPSTSSPTPTVQTTPLPTPTSAQTPSPAQINSYNQLIAQYSGVQDFPADDTVQEGTSNEKGVIVSTNWFYTENAYALAGFPIRFISDGNAQCTLHALSVQGDLAIGTLRGNDSFLFTATPGTDETLRFRCQERPTITLDLNIFS